MKKLMILMAAFAFLFTGKSLLASVQINDKGQKYTDYGYYPCVTALDDGRVVEIHNKNSEYKNDDYLFSGIGINSPTKTFWIENHTHFDKGLKTSITALSDNIILNVHDSSSGDGSIWSEIGIVNVDNVVNWLPNTKQCFKTYYHCDPCVIRLKENKVLEVNGDQSGNGLAYTMGEYSGNNIKWFKNLWQNHHSADPSITLLPNGNVLEVCENNNHLEWLYGVVSYYNNTVSWKPITINGFNEEGCEPTLLCYNNTILAIYAFNNNMYYTQLNIDHISYQSIELSTTKSAKYFSNGKLPDITTVGNDGTFMLVNSTPINHGSHVYSRIGHIYKDGRVAI